VKKRKFEAGGVREQRNMGKKIVATGRGGTGKSTFVALASRYLAAPMLLIDIDPDQSLAEMLGIDLEEEGVRTISDALYDIIEERRSDGGNPMPLHDRMEYLLNRECLYEGKRFDLIVLGTKLTEGCYCIPDDLIKTIIPRLANHYPNVVIDSPAGLEHLNRKIVSDIDDLFVILDPSSKSLKHIARIKDITRQIGIGYSHLYLVGNYRFDNRTEEYLETTGEAYLGKIEYDADVQGYNMAGRSLLDLPKNSPASVSVREVLARADEMMGSS
jgi:CO dehydrogenase maturation factor